MSFFNMFIGEVDKDGEVNGIVKGDVINYNNEILSELPYLFAKENMDTEKVITRVKREYMRLPMDADMAYLEKTEIGLIKLFVIYSPETRDLSVYKESEIANFVVQGYDKSYSLEAMCGICLDDENKEHILNIPEYYKPVFGAVGKSCEDEFNVEFNDKGEEVFDKIAESLETEKLTIDNIELNEEEKKQLLDSVVAAIKEIKLTRNKQN